MSRPHVLFVTYNGLLEPLGQRQGLAYLEPLSDRYRFTVLSWEKPGSEGTQPMRARLDRSGIAWVPLRYHARPRLLATAWDVLRGVREARRLHRADPVALVHARAYVPAAVALRLKRRHGIPWIFDMRGLLPDEYAEAGLWGRGSVPHRLTLDLERRLLEDADGLVTNSSRAEAILRARADLPPPGEIPWEVLPACASLEDFRPRPEARRRVRDQLGAGERTILVYAGSLGTWYLLREMADLFLRARKAVPGLLFLVLANQDPEGVERRLGDAGVEPGDRRVLRLPPEDVPAHLAAADAGVVFVRPLPSKRASFPTKVAEYLATGLPVVVSRGVGDVEDLAGEPAVRVVDALDPEDRERAAAALPALLRDGSGEPARTLARRRFSLEEVGVPAYARLYRALLGEEAR